MLLKSGHIFVPPEGRLKELCDQFKLRGKIVLLKPDDWTVCEAYMSFSDKYYDFKVF